MNGLFEAALEVQRFCDDQGWGSCFIGGLAVQRWGEPRVTRDVDLTLIAGFGKEAEFIDPLLRRFPARVDDAKNFALQNRVLLLRTDGGVGIDISLGALPYEDLLVRRASAYEFAAGILIRTCSAEDLLVLKLFASRPLDLQDAEAIALRNKGTLDWNYVKEHLTPLSEIKGDAGILRSLDRIQAL